MKLRVGCCHLDKRKSLGCHLGKAFGGLASAGPHAIRLRTICAARKETTPETREESQQTVLWPESEGDGVESAPQPAAVRQPPGRAPARHPARLSRRQQQLESDLWGLPPQQDLRGQEGHLHQQEEEQQEQQAELKAQLDPHALQGDGRHRHRRPVSADQDPAAASLRGDNGSNSKGGGGGGAGGAGGNAAADAGYAQQQEHVSSAAPAERPAQTSPPRSSSHSTNIRAPAGKVDPAAAEAGAARPTASQGAQPPAQAQEHEQQQQRRQEQQQQEGAATASGGRRLRLRRGLAAAAAPTRVSVRLPLSQRPQPWVVKAILEGRQREQEEEQQGQQRRQAGAEGQGKEAAKGRGTGKPGAQAGATVAAPREGKAGAPAEKRAGKQTSAPASGATGAHGQTKAPSKEDAKQGQQRKKGKDSKKKGAKAQDAQPSRPKWTGPGVVAVHPDGCTLWAHRRRDSTDMAEAVLLVLQQQVAVLQEQQLLQQQQRGVGRGVGAGAGEGEGGASDGPPPTCHVLAVGPQQNYNVMRALSYNQEILRLMAHNGMSLAGAAASPARLASMPTGPVHSRAGGSPGGAGAAASAGPSPSAMPMLLCAVTGVSLPATRSFYQETLRAGGTLDPVVGSSVVYGTAGVVPEVGTSPGYTPPGTGAPAGAGVRAAAAASAAAGTAAQRRGQQRAESRLDSAVKHPAPRHAVADGDGGGAGVGEAHDLDPEAEAMAPGLPGWPSQASVLQPRVLYTVMGPLALDLPAWAAAAAAAGLQPLAVSEGCTAEQVRRLAEMAAARVQRRGHCCLQAMGYLAASRAAEVLRVAAALLAEAGCGCVLVPHTTAVPLPQWTKRSQDVDGMQGAVGQQQQGTGAAGVKAAGGKGKMGKGGGAGGFIGAVREAVGQASGELGAALAASAPSLVGRGSQLELHLLACEWGAEGQPLLRAPGGTQAGAQAAGPAATGAAAALQSVLQGQQDEGQGEQAVKSGTSGNRGSSGGAGSSEMERVAVTVPWPEASAVEGEFEVQGAPDGGLAAAVKRACCSLPVGRWLRVRCVGLGAVARVPVLLRRPGRWYVDADGVRQGHATPWVAWQVGGGCGAVVVSCRARDKKWWAHVRPECAACGDKKFGRRSTMVQPYRGTTVLVD